MEKTVEETFLSDITLPIDSIIINKNSDQLCFWSTSTPIYRDGNYIISDVIIRIEWVRYLLKRCQRKEDTFYMYVVNLNDIISVKYDLNIIFSDVTILELEGKLFTKKDKNEIWRTIT